MVAAEEDPPRADHVEPGHGVFAAGVALLAQREELVEPAERDGFDAHGRAGDGLQLQLRPGDEPRQAQAADGRREELVSWRALDAAVRAEQLEPPHMPAEGPGA